MAVLHECVGHVVFVDEEEPGWLPPGAKRPAGRPRRHVLVDLEVHGPEEGRSAYLLVTTSSEPRFNGDTWHETLGDAFESARSLYDVGAADW